MALILAHKRRIGILQTVRCARPRTRPAEIRKLLVQPRGFSALDFYFDAEGRAQIGSLHDASANQAAAARKIGGF